MSGNEIQMDRFEFVGTDDPRLDPGTCVASGCGRKWSRLIYSMMTWCSPGGDHVLLAVPSYAGLPPGPSGPCDFHIVPRDTIMHEAVTRGIHGFQKGLAAGNAAHRKEKARTQ